MNEKTNIKCTNNSVKGYYEGNLMIEYAFNDDRWIQQVEATVQANWSLEKARDLYQLKTDVLNKIIEKVAK